VLLLDCVSESKRVALVNTCLLIPCLNAFPSLTRCLSHILHELMPISDEKNGYLVTFPSKEWSLRYIIRRREHLVSILLSSEGTMDVYRINDSKPFFNELD
jgi:hypothetical protein